LAIARRTWSSTKPLVAADVELIDAQRVGRGLGDGFEPGLAHRAEHMGDAELLRGPCHGGAAALMKDFERADRRQQQRQPQPAPEPLDRRVDPAHVAQHARPERERIQRHAVAPQRGLALGAADDVIPVVLVEILARLLDDLVQRLKFGAHGRTADRRSGFIGVDVGFLFWRFIHGGSWSLDLIP